MKVAATSDSPPLFTGGFPGGTPLFPEVSGRGLYCTSRSESTSTGVFGGAVTGAKPLTCLTLKSLVLTANEKIYILMLTAD